MDKFDANFRFLGQHDVSALRDKVATLVDSDWNREPWRQERFKIHRYTQTIELIFDQDFRHENPTRRDSFDRLGCESLLAPIEKTIFDSAGGTGYTVRALLVNLKAGGRIPPHEDTGYSLMASRRVHIPIISNDRVVFTIGGEAKVMRQGELWEVNNARVHSVLNDGESDRVHLILDCVC
jgi:hypothetical protein